MLGGQQFVLRKLVEPRYPALPLIFAFQVLLEASILAALRLLLKTPWRLAPKPLWERPLPKA
jgi:hypothetical protein